MECKRPLGVLSMASLVYLWIISPYAHGTIIAPGCGKIGPEKENKCVAICHQKHHTSVKVHFVVVLVEKIPLLLFEWSWKNESDTMLKSADSIWIRGRSSLRSSSTLGLALWDVLVERAIFIAVYYLLASNWFTISFLFLLTYLCPTFASTSSSPTAQFACSLAAIG